MIGHSAVVHPNTGVKINSCIVSVRYYFMHLFVDYENIQIPCATRDTSQAELSKACLISDYHLPITPLSCRPK